MDNDKIQIDGTQVTKIVPQTVVVEQTIIYTQINPDVCSFEYKSGRWMFKVILSDDNESHRKEVYVEISKEQIEAVLGKIWQESTTLEYFNAVMALAVSKAREAVIQ